MLNEKNDTGTIWMMGFNVTVACNTFLFMAREDPLTVHYSLFQDSPFLDITM